MRFRPFVLVACCLALSTAASADATAPIRPELVVEILESGFHRIFVEVPAADGSAERHLLHETIAVPTPGATGIDPSGRASFVNWTEGGRRWTSWSRDGGATWSPAGVVDVLLRLRAGTAGPGDELPTAGAGLSAAASGRLFLVQFRTIGLPEWREALAAAGAEVLSFVPSNAHIVRMDPALASRIAALDFVERVAPYHPSYRLEPELRAWLDAPVSADGARESMRVRAMAFAWGPEGKERIRAAAEGAGATVASWYPSGHILELAVNRAQLRTIASHDEVVWIDRWSPPENDMDLVREDNGANALETATEICGQGVRGEVLDAGIESTHQDFDGIIMHTAADVQSHGTSTYGIVFGNGARDGDGQAKGTSNLPCKDGGIFADYNAVTDRFAHTQELKGAPYFASFQSNSWGDALTTAYTSISSQMDDIIWRLDIAICQSQSNNGNQSSRPQAWAKNIISVGGIRHYDTLSTSDDAWANGASIGPAADGRLKPDVNYWYDSIYTTTTGNTYTSGFGGTSAATPITCGTLGLMVKLWSDNAWGTNPTGSTVFERQPHFATMKALLINNAQQYSFTGTTSDLTRTHQGWGRPDAEIARQRAATSFVVDQTEALQIGQSSSYNVVVAAGESELKVTMAYPDPPGTTSSTLHRINDLNLKVTSPTGTVYWGNNGLNAGNYSTSGGTANTVDTVENVFIQNPAAGTWTVEVSAAEINQDAYTATPAADAVFALVVTGAMIQSSGFCGDGIRQAGEACDGTDLGTATCATQGCSGGGTLACTASCTFDRTGCSGCPTCDHDGTCEVGEDCTNCSSDCFSASSAVCGNHVCEPVAGEDCLSCPTDCNGNQGGKPSSRYCCGDGAGTNPVSCSNGVCTGSGNTCNGGVPPNTCCGDSVCNGTETSANCAVDCGGAPVCGDTQCNGGETSCTCPADCGSPAPSEVVNATCKDGLDNDCDGNADCNDGDCTLDPGCRLCSPSGATCSTNAQCCSNRCRRTGTTKTCQ